MVAIPCHILPRSILEVRSALPFDFQRADRYLLSVSFAILAHLFSYNISWSATVKEVESSNFFREVPRIWKRYYPTFIVCGGLIGAMIVLSLNIVPRAFVVNGKTWAVIVPLAMQCGAHILFPVRPVSFANAVCCCWLTFASAQIVLNPWLVIFSY